MEDQVQSTGQSAEEVATFTSQLLADLRALDALIESDRIESGRRRIGAEQEVFLVGDDWRPALIALEALEKLDDSHFTTELALYNLEFNLDPHLLEDRAFSRLEAEINSHLQRLRRVAQSLGCEAILIGILPTLTAEHLTLDSITPRPRYLALNQAVRRLRGEDFHFRIRGRDELVLRHDNVMPEACNTSFQVHYQVGAEEFARKYNVAQLVAAPVLAVATNSPILFDRQLWAETRIALFQQATDARPTVGIRRSQPRVSFGSHWLESCITEIFREDIARFRTLIGEARPEDSIAVVESGEVPELHALRQHNGTVYRWNRPCYGVHDGIAHLRIENRVLPAGPTVIDEVANAAFWIGLMEAGDDAFGAIPQRLAFAEARSNFLAAARNGLRTEVGWLDGQRLSMTELVLEVLLPIAYQGLESLGIAEEDQRRYLDVIEARAASGQTGSRWLCDFANSLSGDHGPRQPMASLVAGAHRRQIEGSPGHTWATSHAGRPSPRSEDYKWVRNLMSTDLITIGPNQPVELAASIMRWRRIRHLPVEGHDHRLLGLVSERSLLNLVAARRKADEPPTLVRDVMSRELVTVTPSTELSEAVRRMRVNRVSCLPVVDDSGRSVGILSERDLISVAAPLLDRFLANDGDPREQSEEE